MPITSQLVGINSDGIAALANGTYWRIAPGDLARAKKWLTGGEVTVTPTDVHKPIRKVNLTNIDTGERVAAMQSNSPPNDPTMKGHRRLALQPERRCCEPVVNRVQSTRMPRPTMQEKFSGPD